MNLLLKQRGLTFKRFYFLGMDFSIQKPRLEEEVVMWVDILGSDDF